jgi:hypothetical protein
MLILRASWESPEEFCETRCPIRLTRIRCDHLPPMRSWLSSFGRVLAARTCLIAIRRATVNDQGRLYSLGTSRASGSRQVGIIVSCRMSSAHELGVWSVTGSPSAAGLSRAGIQRAVLA